MVVPRPGAPGERTCGGRPLPDLVGVPPDQCQRGGIGSRLSRRCRWPAGVGQTGASGGRSTTVGWPSRHPTLTPPIQPRAPFDKQILAHAPGRWIVAQRGGDGDYRLGSRARRSRGRIVRHRRWPTSAASPRLPGRRRGVLRTLWMPPVPAYARPRHVTLADLAGGPLPAGSTISPGSGAPGTAADHPLPRAPAVRRDPAWPVAGSGNSCDRRRGSVASRRCRSSPTPRTGPGCSSAVPRVRLRRLDRPPEPGSPLVRANAAAWRPRCWPAPGPS